MKIPILLVGKEVEVVKKRSENSLSVHARERERERDKLTLQTQEPFTVSKQILLALFYVHIRAVLCVVDLFAFLPCYKLLRHA